MLNKGVCPVCKKMCKNIVIHIAKKQDKEHKLYIENLNIKIDALLLNTDLYMNEISDYIYNKWEIICWDSIVAERENIICPGRGYEIMGKRRIGENNPMSSSEVREKVSNSIIQKWESGVYDQRINGMLDKIGKDNPNFNLYKNLKWRYREIYNTYHGNTNCLICGEDKTNIHHIDEDHDNFLLTNLQSFCVPHHMDKHYGARQTPYISIVKIFTFDSCHNLFNYSGKCQYLHGHTYKLEIKLRNRIDMHTSMVMDFGILKDVINEHIIEPLDHKYLQDEIPHFNPTAENMLLWIWDRLERSALLKGLTKIRLWETPTSYAEINQKDVLMSGLYVNSYYEDLEKNKLDSE